MNKLLCFPVLLMISINLFAQKIPDAYQQLESDFNNSEYSACITREGAIADALTQNRMDTIAANTFYYLGESFNQLGNVDKALNYFEKEKTVRAHLREQDPISYTNTLYNLSYIYLQEGKYENAGVNADELVAIDKKVHEQSSHEFASTVFSVADIYIQLNRFDDAERLLKSTIKKQPEKSIGAGILYNRLGDLYSYVGQYSKAQIALETSLDILFDAAGENSGEYMSAAITLGSLYMGQGKYPEAEELFDVALHYLKPEDIAYNTVLNNQALVYQSLGQLERSETLFEDIKELDSVAIGTTHPDYAITLANLGQVLCDEKKFSDAEKCLKAALEIQKLNKETATASYARKLNNLARIYLESGKPDKAIPILEQAQAIYKKTSTENSPQFAATMFNLGVAEWKAGKGTIAIKHLKAAADIRAKVQGKKHPEYARVIEKIAEYQWLNKQLGEAHKSFGQVFENDYFQIDATFPGLTEEEKSRFYYTNIKGDFEKFNSFVVASNTQIPALLTDMYNYHINTKGAIMYATEKVREAIIHSNDSSLIKLYDSWHERKEEIARYYSQNQDGKSLDSLVMATDAIEKELTRRSSTFASQYARKKYKWQDIQKALKPGEAAIEVLRFKKYTPEPLGNFSGEVNYAFLIVTSSAAQPQLVVLEKGNDLESKFVKFYQNSIHYNMDDQYSYKNFFESLADALKKNNITKFYFSPDGVYNQVNINTIQNPFTKKYLIDEYDITLVTNTREILEPHIKDSNVKDPILIGFPKFNLTKGTPNATLTPTKATRSRGGVTRGMRGLLRLMRGNEGITELPGTQKEIAEISSLFSKQPTTYLEQHATEDIAKQVNNPAYLHIATHGYFLGDDENLAGSGDAKSTAQNNAAVTRQQYVANPLLKAGLILAGAENFLLTGDPINDAGDDGILTAYEAMNLKLDNTRLVVLSACETGLGHVKNGEGVYGLQRALKIAGTQSIVMSLWSVDDDATQELMTAFYKELIATGDQHNSFRNAQQKIKEKYKKPFYWGAFVMVGM